MEYFELYDAMLLRKTDNYILMGVEQDNSDEASNSPQIQSLIAHSLLIECLKLMNIYENNPKYYYGKFGKPYLQNYQNIQFNISHCSQAIFCAVAKNEIGIDVETIREVDWDIVERVLNPEEIKELIKSNSPAITFCKFWTRKESYLKFLGAGISDHLKNVLDNAKQRFETIEMLTYTLSICY